MARKPGRHPHSKKGVPRKKHVYKKNSKGNQPTKGDKANGVLSQPPPAVAVPNSSDTSDGFAIPSPASMPRPSRTPAATVPLPKAAPTTPAKQGRKTSVTAAKTARKPRKPYVERTTPTNTALRVGQKFVTVNPPQLCTVTDVHLYGETATVQFSTPSGNSSWEKVCTLDKGRLPFRVVPFHQTPLHDIPDRLGSYTQEGYAATVQQVFQHPDGGDNPPIVAVVMWEEQMSDDEWFEVSIADVPSYVRQAAGGWLIRALATFGYASSVHLAADRVASGASLGDAPHDTDMCPA